MKRQHFPSNEQSGCHKTAFRLQMWSKTLQVCIHLCASSQNRLTYSVTLQTKHCANFSHQGRTEVCRQWMWGADASVFAGCLTFLRRLCIPQVRLDVTGMQCTYLTTCVLFTQRRSAVTPQRAEAGKITRHSNSLTNTTEKRTVRVFTHQETWCCPRSRGGVCLRGTRDDETPLQRHCGPHSPAPSSSRVCVEGVEETSLLPVRWKQRCCKTGISSSSFFSVSSHATLRLSRAASSPSPPGWACPVSACEHRIIRPLAGLSLSDWIASSHQQCWKIYPESIFSCILPEMKMNSLADGRFWCSEQLKNLRTLGNKKGAKVLTVS